MKGLDERLDHHRLTPDARRKIISILNTKKLINRGFIEYYTIINIKYPDWLYYRKEKRYKRRHGIRGSVYSHINQEKLSAEGGVSDL